MPIERYNTIEKLKALTLVSRKSKLISVIVIVFFSVSLIALFLNSLNLETSKPTRIYGETGSITRKEISPKHRVIFPISDFLHEGGAPESNWPAEFGGQCEIIVSTGTKYEIQSEDDWNQIRVNDEIRQYYWSNEGFIKEAGFHCWLEVWRNGTLIKNVEVYYLGE